MYMNASVLREEESRERCVLDVGGFHGDGIPVHLNSFAVLM